MAILFPKFISIQASYKKLTESVPGNGLLHTTMNVLNAEGTLKNGQN